MSPDSSINSATKSLLAGNNVNAKPYQTVIRVQVQECSQSQQPAHHQQPQQSIFMQATSTAASATATPVIMPAASSGNIYFVKSEYGQHQRISNDHQMLKQSAIVGAVLQPAMLQPVQPQQLQQVKVAVQQQQQPRRPETPEYTKGFPVMDTTVASSVKGEPDLNIGNVFNALLFSFRSVFEQYLIYLLNAFILYTIKNKVQLIIIKFNKKNPYLHKFLQKKKYLENYFKVFVFFFTRNF